MTIDGTHKKYVKLLFGINYSFKNSIKSISNLLDILNQCVDSHSTQTHDGNKMSLQRFIFTIHIVLSIKYTCILF